MNRSLQEKIGQLLVVGIKGKTVSHEEREFIKNNHIGSIILFGRNVGTPEEVLALTTELQQIAKDAGHDYPLLICVDQENGVVRRLGEGTTILPGAMTLGASGDETNAYEMGVITGKELKALGINWNLAPVLDVNNNPDNPVIGVRSYGESAEQVAAFGREAMKGMQATGVITTLKHFPGHGDTNVDSHLGLPTIPHSLERLEEVELRPFKECINSGADTIMSAHIYFPALEAKENLPATLSKSIITGLLREKLGFNGVVTTDCMEMDAIGKTIGTESGSVEAIKAGVDLVMISHILSKQMGAIEKIKEAVEAGEIDETLVNQAYERVLSLKEKYVSWDDISLEGEQQVPELVGCNEHEEKAYEVYRQGVTVVKNDSALLQAINRDANVLVIEPENSTRMQVEDKKYSNLALGAAVQLFHDKADILTMPLTDEQIASVQSINYEVVIVGTLTASPGSNQVCLVEKLIEQGKKVVVVAMRSPYDINHLPEGIAAYINTYEFSFPALKVAAGVIFGKETASGKSPVTLKVK